MILQFIALYFNIIYFTIIILILTYLLNYRSSSYYYSLPLLPPLLTTCPTPPSPVLCPTKRRERRTAARGVLPILRRAVRLPPLSRLHQTASRTQQVGQGRARWMAEF